MNTRDFIPSGQIRPFSVHFLIYGEPSDLLVLAKSPCHAVQVMFRYYQTFYHSLDMISYDNKNKDCYVTPLNYFSDSLYKHLKKLNHGNN